LEITPGYKYPHCLGKIPFLPKDCPTFFIFLLFFKPFNFFSFSFSFNFFGFYFDFVFLQLTSSTPASP